MTIAFPLRLSLALLAGLSPMTAVGQETLLWSEEFNEAGPPDPEVWTHDLGYLGVNNELQVYTNDPLNVRVAGGYLVIHARRESNGTFTSGRIKTQGKVMFQYGTVEARIKIPDLGDGLWPAFWTLGNDISSVGWPRCGEIDILEMGAGDAIADGVVNRRVYSTAHWDFFGDYASYGQNVTAGVELNEDFHIFRLEWTPTAIRTYLDGQQVWVMDISNREAMSGQEFHAPHFLLVNMAVGGWFPGITNPSQISADLPAAYVVDYIRIYDNGHTILSGPGSEPEECRGDFDLNGRVDSADLGRMIAAWNTTAGRYDLNEDGTVDAADIGLLIGLWGECP